EAEAAELEARLHAQAPARPGRFEGMEGWNWDSNPQVQQVLTLLGFPVESVDDDVLAGIGHPLAEMLRQYRGARKRCSTYGGAWLQHVAADGRVSPAWKQLGAEASGRMSCREPNMQQLPRGKAYRRCVAAPAGRVLVKADYSQIELRIAAKVSGD